MNGILIRMGIEDQNDKIIQQLEILNARIQRQNSIRHIAVTGIIYGIGFFIGSAILATIVLGLLGPVVGKISWVKENFDRGASILQTR